MNSITDISIDTEQVEQPLWLSNFVETYQKLGTDNLELIKTIYDDNVEFQDPAHRLQGLSQLEAYFANLYQNLASCTFVVNGVMWQQQQAAVYWVMEYCHSGLNAGRPIRVEGHSLIKSNCDKNDEKVVYHRDYVDMGAMVYEYIPVVGFAIKKIKQRMAR